MGKHRQHNNNSVWLRGEEDGKSRVRWMKYKQNCQKSQQKFYIIKIMTLMLDECGFGWGSAGEFRF